ncbi:MAG: hypothetical protein L0Z55_05000 [Planctomycetes bacterium]|nr:hypothetical protein [Planctomycetota bacterium]
MPGRSPLYLAVCVAVGIVVCVSVAISAAGCVGVLSARHPSHGPPPHAPAHGYRHHHPDNVELRFDVETEVYVVVEQPGCYFHDGSFYRAHGGGWEMSISIEGPWSVAVVDKVPHGLRKAPPGHGPGHPGKGHGKGKEKSKER